MLFDKKSKSFMLPFVFLVGAIFCVKMGKKQDSATLMNQKFNKDAPRSNLFIPFLTGKLLSLTIYS